MIFTRRKADEHLLYTKTWNTNQLPYWSNCNRKLKGLFLYEMLEQIRGWVYYF